MNPSYVEGMGNIKEQSSVFLPLISSFLHVSELNTDPKIDWALVRLARSVEGRETNASNQIHNKGSELSGSLCQWEFAHNSLYSAFMPVL